MIMLYFCYDAVVLNDVILFQPDRTILTLLSLLPNSALQIFKLESHPSGFKAETGREGFSLYGMYITVKCLD